MPNLHWQKSTYSPDGSNCLEIAPTPTTIHIRDSKTLGDDKVGRTIYWGRQTGERDGQ